MHDDSVVQSLFRQQPSNILWKINHAWSFKTLFINVSLSIPVIFCFSLTKANARNIRLYFPYWQYTDFCWRWWRLTTMFIHLPLIHFAPPPRLLIDFKNSKWLTYFCILLCIIMHLLLFLSPDWLTFCHVIISHINSLGSRFIFCFPLTKGQCSKR